MGGWVGSLYLGGGILEEGLLGKGGGGGGLGGLGGAGLRVMGKRRMGMRFRILDSLVLE